MTREEIEKILSIGYNKGYEAGIADMQAENEKAIEAAQESIIDKACEWLKDNYPYYFETDIEQEFIKAMKGE